MAADPGRTRVPVCAALGRAALTIALALPLVPSPAAGNAQAAGTSATAGTLAVASLPGPAAATTTPPDTAPAVDAPLIDKPASVAKRPAAGLVWIDAGVRRPLFLDTGLRADFSPTQAGKAGVLRRADGPLKDVPSMLQSPVLRDESGRARALPGGVLLVIDAALDDAAARALIERHGAVAVRRVAGPVWLVASPPGLASLDLANRLAETGVFGSAQPNWWVERPKK
jgi:hypothetical protein